MKTDRSKTRIAIAVARFNAEVTTNLAKLATEELVRSGVPAKNVREFSVPGAYELPFVAKRLAASGRYDAVICLGCVIKGDTSHDVYVAAWASIGIGQVSLETGVPVLFGVLTPNNEEQAVARAKPGPLDRGTEMARAALEMIDFAQDRGN